MFSKNRFSLFITVSCLLVMVGVGLRAHFVHDPKRPELDFTSNPSITCNIDGDTFTHTRVTDENGNASQDWWYKTPKDPVFKIEARAHGFGWAHITFYGNYDGKKYGDTQNSTNQKLGSSVGFVPFFVGIDHDIKVERYGDFSKEEGEYSWDGSGSIKLVPWYWQWSLAVVIPSGSWVPAPSEFHNTQDDSTSGSWTVEHNYSSPTEERVPIGDDDSGSGTTTTDTTDTTDEDTSTTDDDSSTSSTSPYSLSASSTGSPFSSGDTVTLTLSGSESFYSVDWSLESPQYSTPTPLSYESGDGSSYDSSTSYTFPSGYTGDFVFKAVVYTYGNMTRYEHTYTVTVGY